MGQPPSVSPISRNVVYSGARQVAGVVTHIVGYSSPPQCGMVYICDLLGSLLGGMLGLYSATLDGGVR